MSTEMSNSNKLSPVSTGASGWLTEGLLDAEYKEYMLLAWLQKVKAELRGTKLYPALAEVIRKHRELSMIREGLEKGRIQGPVEGIDFAKMQLLRSRIKGHSDLVDYLEDLIERALPHLTETMKEGKSLYDLIDSRIEFTPIGVQPLHVREGYLLVTHGASHERQLMAYRYTQSRVQQGGDAFLELSLKCVESRPLSRVETTEAIKWTLIRRHRDLPQPATFHVHMEWKIPVDPTLLPIARRRLLREIAQC